MNFKEFTGKVQHRLELSEQGEAVRATRAVLTTLGERLQEGEARDLAGPLPMEIDWYLEQADSSQHFDFDEFVTRVCERQGKDAGNEDNRSDAAYHGRAIVALLGELVSESEMNQIREQLPSDEGWEELFTLVGVEGAFD
ncbi:DUF2267 domain-containing protein [Halorussus halophilus]|uniref:DUF2267 domain-containing protein n=1 Tax=Halorussus halophilus TaxID=2650975 RepID=UPI001300E0F9|nr:DUF2267 domain-containing protein [Halorussus halophilus]